MGPAYGYYWLIVKEDYHSNAAATFEGTNIHVTSTGRPYLEAALGTATYIDQFVTEKVIQWSEIALCNCYHTVTCILCCVHPWAFNQIVLSVPPTTSNTWRLL